MSDHTAASEAARQAAIDAIALPEHEKLVAALKADPTVTVGQASMRIVEAEQAARAAKLEAVKQVENTLDDNSLLCHAVFRELEPAALFRLCLERWQRSETARARFPTAETYATIMVGRFVTAQAQAQRMSQAHARGRLAAERRAAEGES